MPLSEIRKIIPTLSQAELSQLKVEVDFLTANKQALAPYQQLLYRNIVGALRRRHVRYMPFNEEENYLPRLRGYNHKAFLEAYEAVEEFIRECFLTKGLPDALRHQFYSILVWETVRMLSDQHEAAGIVGILTALKDPDKVLDNAFPGYARAGVLRNILG